MISAIRQIEQEMSAATPPTTSETLSPDQVEVRRKFCNWLALWRHCDAPACRRAHACAGDPTPCFARFYADCPEPMRVWVRAGSIPVEEGSTARLATRVADSALLGHLKVLTGLPPRRRRRKRPK